MCMRVKGRFVAFLAEGKIRWWRANFCLGATIFGEKLVGTCTRASEVRITTRSTRIAVSSIAPPSPTASFQSKSSVSPLQGASNAVRSNEARSNEPRCCLPTICVTFTTPIHDVQTHTLAPRHPPAAATQHQAGRERVLQGQPRGVDGHNQSLRKLHAGLE